MGNQSVDWWWNCRSVRCCLVGGHSFSDVIVRKDGEIQSRDQATESGQVDGLDRWWEVSQSGVHSGGEWNSLIRADWCHLGAPSLTQTGINSMPSLRWCDSDGWGDGSRSIVLIVRMDECQSELRWRH